jgi:hypothetical protein
LPQIPRSTDWESKKGAPLRGLFSREDHATKYRNHDYAGLNRTSTSALKEAQSKQPLFGTENSFSETAWRRTNWSMSNTTETPFQAGSISKPIAAIAALRLVREGGLFLDQNVNDLLTSWRLSENSFTAKSQ